MTAWVCATSRRCLVALLVTLAAFTATGCGDARYRADGEHAALRFHTVFADRDGYPIHPATENRFPVEPTPERQTFAGYLDEAFAHMDGYFAKDYLTGTDAEQGRTRKILVHVHGGLNTFGSALANAENLYRRIASDPTFSDRYYPFFVCWNSDGLSTYGEDLFEVSQGQKQPVLSSVISPVSFTVDVASGVVWSPMTWWRQIVDIDLAPGLGRDHLDRDSLAGKNPQVLRDHGIDVGMGRTDRSGWQRTWSAIKYWPTLPIKIVTNPLICGIGRSSWNMMLRRTDTIFHVTDEFALTDDRLRAAASRDRLLVAHGAAALFFDQLRSHLLRAQAAEPGVRYEIMVVGHSMGSIVLNKVLTTFTDLPIRRILYMAPACSIQEAAASVVPFIQRQNAAVPAQRTGLKAGDNDPALPPLQQGQYDRHHYTQFHVLTLAPQAEKSEASGWETLPRGSLLEWVDNFYSSPPSAVDRRLGTWENLMSAVTPFLPIGGDIHFKAFGWKPGSEPSTHGAFNLCPFWKEDFRRIPQTDKATDIDDPLFYSQFLD